MPSTEELIVTARWQGQQLEAGAAKGKEALDKVGAGARGAKSEMDKMQGATNTLRNAMVGLGVALSARQLLDYADTWKNLTNQLKLVSDNATVTRSALVRVATDTSSSLQGTVTLFARMTRATADLGYSQARMIALTKTINQAMLLSGATATESAAALIQLSQAFSSGRLAGEEFRSISEQAPMLLDLLAQALGKTRGQIRQMAIDQKLTTEVMIAGWESVGEEVNRQAATIELTLGRALENLKTRFTEWVGLSDEASGTTSSLATAVETLSTNLWAVEAALKAIAVAMALPAVMKLLGKLGALGAGAAGAGAAGGLGAVAVVLETAARAGVESAAGRGPKARAVAGWWGEPLYPEKGILGDTIGRIPITGPLGVALGGLRGWQEQQRATVEAEEKALAEAANATPLATVGGLTAKQQEDVDKIKRIDADLAAYRLEVAATMDTDMRELVTLQAAHVKQLAELQKEEMDPALKSVKIAQLRGYQAAELELTRQKQAEELATKAQTKADQDATQALREQERRQREFERANGQRWAAEAKANEALAASALRLSSAQLTVAAGNRQAFEQSGAQMVQELKARQELATARAAAKGASDTELAAMEAQQRAILAIAEQRQRDAALTNDVADIQADVFRKLQEQAKAFGDSAAALLAAPESEQVKAVWDNEQTNALIEQQGLLATISAEDAKALADMIAKLLGLGAGLDATTKLVQTQTQETMAAAGAGSRLVQALGQLSPGFAETFRLVDDLIAAMNAGGLAKWDVSSVFGLATAGVNVFMAALGDSESAAAEAAARVRELARAARDLAGQAPGKEFDTARDLLLKPARDLYAGLREAYDAAAGAGSGGGSAVAEAQNTVLALRDVMTAFAEIDDILKIKATFSRGTSFESYFASYPFSEGLTALFARVSEATGMSAGAWVESMQALFGDSMATAAQQMFSTADAVDTLTESLTAAEEAASRLYLDMREMVLRQQAAAAFRGTGGDLGAQARIYRELAAQVAALGALGTTTGAGAGRAAVGGTGTPSTGTTGTGIAAPADVQAAVDAINTAVSGWLTTLHDQLQASVDSALASLSQPRLSADEAAQIQQMLSVYDHAQQLIDDAFAAAQTPSLSPYARDVLSHLFDANDRVQAALDAAAAGATVPKLSPGQQWLVASAFRILSDIEKAKDAAAEAATLPALSTGQRQQLEGALGYLAVIQGTLDAAAAALAMPGLTPYQLSVIGHAFDFAGDVRAALDTAAAEATVPSLSPGQQWLIANAFSVLADIEKAKDAAAAASRLPCLSGWQREQLAGALHYLTDIQGTIDSAASAASIPGLTDYQRQVLGHIFDALDQVQRAINAAAEAAAPATLSPGQQWLCANAFRVLREIERAKDEAAMAAPIPALSDMQRGQLTGALSYLNDIQGTIDSAVAAAQMPGLSPYAMDVLGHMFDALDSVQEAIDNAFAQATVPTITAEQQASFDRAMGFIIDAQNKIAGVYAASGPAGKLYTAATEGVVLDLSSRVTVDPAVVRAAIAEALGKLDLQAIIDEAVTPGTIDLAQLVKLSAADLKDRIIEMVNEGIANRKVRKVA